MISNLYHLKQQEVLKFALNNDFFMLINHGAKRTGKTILNNDLFLLELQRVRRIADRLNIKKPQYILAGADLGALQRNVLIELTNKYEIEFNFDKHNRFMLFGVQVCCFGHSKINDLGRIRGMTAFGAYINEGTMANQEVFNEIKSRCSGEGARILIDTNPDNPQHWLRVDYIDKADGKVIQEYNYQLDDNTFLSERYRDNIKRSTPSGMFYDRDILGIWRVAQGAVYGMFDEKVHIKEPEVSGDGEFYISIDYGTQNPTVFLLWEKKKNVAYCIREYYYSGRKTRRQKTDVEFADDLESFIGDLKIRKIIIDPSAASFIAELRKRRFNIKKAKNDVLDGIRFTATLLNKGDLFFSPLCEQTLKEFKLYSWDEKAANRGEDKPIKENDHAMDAVRYFCYTILKSGGISVLK